MQTNTLPITVSVCLDVKLNLKRHSDDSAYINPNPLSEEMKPTAEYLATVMPGAKIEYLGRPNFCYPWGVYYPTSLFFLSVHQCFKDHCPLALRPEVLMYLIVNEVATTVNLHPEHYRHLFSTSNEKVRIDIRNDALRKGNPNSPWHQVLEQFDIKLRDHVPSNLMPNFLPLFSTSTSETNATTMVAFMSTVRKFYDFHTKTMCGLPRVRLLGEAADYSKLCESAERLSSSFQDHLGSYFNSLLPVLRKIEQQASGEPLDTQFWSSLYKFNSESGTDLFNGWIAAFVNYVQTAPQEAYGNRPADAGTIHPKHETLYDWEKEPNFRNYGIAVGSIPTQISVAPFIWHYFEEELPMQFVGGVLGVDNVDGYATPSLSYAVVHKD
ncbi:MAG: hypothetical protein UR66_C0004G0085 [Candidatus Moranbacteria bacterium GW2011_GWE1_35_17]|nr:MAG: hypothetical protein UR65_C0072G0002 [Candidatus Moranbacteria bacterium GW2011_GWE2_35_164]KKP68685.1 MAG: hypothetical protein UR66_C0004G0085 [Candidatus Moranbacteria bacterium GW2011_GWE1_35_17]KKP82924.1 MAG: hypothetical protein UR83_C0042G0004 [Candidatus Moranbacteria bacterium GW2011_GWF2_35_54]KKP84654.1 MAG: hypothetical protein UR82_C0001G0021 [Candidatus Moranbacteria bacterium GW2011_GWF1_35_5]